MNIFFSISFKFNCCNSLSDNTYIPSPFLPFISGKLAKCFSLKVSDSVTIPIVIFIIIPNGIEFVYFPHTDTGYVVGDTGTILKTIDGGTTWIAQTSGTDNSLYAVSFADVSTGYAVGASGTILKTTNGGYGTSIRETGLEGSAFSIYPNPASNKVIIANNRKISGAISTGIFNIQGQLLIYAEFHNQDMFRLDVNSLSPGIYLVKIQTSAGVEVEKLVIQ